MAKAGRRKPRKRTSSKRGARRTPKRVMIQMSEGVRKKSSMGMFLGRVTSEETACTVNERTMPMGMSLMALRRGAAGLGLMPSGEGGFQRAGKRSQEMVSVVR